MMLRQVHTLGRIRRIATRATTSGGGATATLRRNALGNTCNGLRRRPLTTVKEGEEGAANHSAADAATATISDETLTSEAKAPSLESVANAAAAKAPSGSGVGLPPPPPPLSSSSISSSASASAVGGKAFKLPPPPPPLNIAVGGASANKQVAASSSIPLGRQAVAESSGRTVGRDENGSKGPKRIIIDDILFGKPSPATSAAASATAVSSVLPITDEQDDHTEDHDEHVDAHVTFHPLTTAQSRAEMHGTSKKGNDGGTNRSSGLMGLLSELEESQNEKEEKQEVEVKLENPIGRESILVSAYASSSILPGSQNENENEIGTNVSESTSILPRADLSDLLPPSLGDGDEKPSFRSKSLLPSVESLFDKEGNKKKNLRIGTGVPDAYRIKKETDNSERGRKGRRKRKGGMSSTNTRRTVASPSVLDQSVQIRSIQDGPHIRYGTGKIAQLAKGYVMASSGKTLVMSTVVHESSSPSSSALSSDASSKDRRVADAIKRQCRKHTGMLPLTVSYSERYAGAGKIPTNKSRRDNMRPTEAETLASRAIDRALRPLLPRECYGSDDAIEINCSVQSFDVSGDSLSGDPIAVAINAASSALLRSGLPISEPVGAVRLCLDCEGTVTFDPSPEQVESAQLDLLLAATRNDIVMIEFGANAPRAYRDNADNDDEAETTIYANRSPGISEEVVADLLRLAHASIQNIIEEQERDAMIESPDDESVCDAKLMAELGLDVSNFPSNILEDNLPEGEDEVAAKQIIEEAFQFISSRLGEAARRLFGSGLAYSNMEVSDSNPVEASIYDGEPLLAKSVRGRREHLVRQEISRLLSDDFVPDKEDLCALYQSIKADEQCGALDDLVSSIHERLLKEAMSRCAIELGTRGDGRAGPNHQGLLSIRPIEANVPLLPDIVHGSALFSRGETQVLCTATLGAPREGLPISNPYATTGSSTPPAEDSSSSEKGPYDDLPVGSLRFLKNQQALESDLNSKRVRADREMTGDSGSLGESRRAFLHYDFPSYSTGETRRPGPAVNRRAIGHGTLAQRGILPILPPPATFPYAIRMTSEVTSSNGSSSMASVCGATLALLDAGVPILAPAAGVSVGLVRGESNSEESYAYLLDLTGTEDHYGEMDFKVCGTDNGLTAMQLDVKRPVPLDIVIQAMGVAREGRNAILSSMSANAEASSAGVIQDLIPRRRPKPSAPRVEIIRFDPARKRDLVGPGGAVLKQLEDRYGVALDLSQEGQCLLYGNDAPAVSKAKSAVQDLVADVVEGEIYQGTVIEIKDFGAVVELLRNKEGLLHVSELGSDETQHPEGNFGLVRKELQVGDQISVRCIGVDPVQGHIKLSRKSLVKDDLVV